jgi:hypothetical protein
MPQIPRKERQAQATGRRGDQTIHNVNVVAKPESQGAVNRPVEVFWRQVDTFESPEKPNGAFLSNGIRRTFDDLQPGNRRDTQMILLPKPFEGWRVRAQDVDQHSAVKNAVHRRHSRRSRRRRSTQSAPLSAPSQPPVKPAARISAPFSGSIFSASASSSLLHPSVDGSSIVTRASPAGTPGGRSTSSRPSLVILPRSFKMDILPPRFYPSAFLRRAGRTDRVGALIVLAHGLALLVQGDAARVRRPPAAVELDHPASCIMRASAGERDLQMRGSGEFV